MKTFTILVTGTLPDLAVVEGETPGARRERLAQAEAVLLGDVQAAGRALVALLRDGGVSLSCASVSVAAPARPADHGAAAVLGIDLLAEGSPSPQPSPQGEGEDVAAPEADGGS